MWKCNEAVPEKLMINFFGLTVFSFMCSSKRLLALAKSLSPAVVRMMGTDGDKMTFDPNCDRHVKHKPYHYDFRNKSMPVFIKDKFTFSCKYTVHECQYLYICELVFSWNFKFVSLLCF